jgi:hypothetical protein
MNRAPQRAATALPALALALCLAGCERSAGPPPAAMAPVEQGDGRVEWAGVQPCTDCDAIDTRLVLAREDGRRRFVLTEVYLAEQPVQFVANGQWERSGALLQLEADDGSRLRYALLEDGRLQPRDLRGRRLPGSDGDGMLMPVASASAAR